MSLYFIEFQPRIQTAHATIATKDSLVSFNCNSVKINDEELCDWRTPQLILASKLVVNTVPRVGLSIRFKTEREYLLEYVLQNAFPVSADMGKPPCCAVMRCLFCNNPLTNGNNVFKRVLPLPSEGWSVSTAFCHGDSHLPSQLTPRKGDLLFGDSVFLLDTCSLSPDRYLLENGSVICKRCHSVCGNTLTQNNGKSSDSGDSLSCSKIELKRSKVSSGPILTSTYSFAQKIYQFSKSKEVFHFKVCNGAGKVYLSVWSMNAISRIVQNGADKLKSVFWDYKGDEGSGAFVKNDDYFLKLMYKSHLGEGVCVGVDEEGMKLETEECLELLLLLTASTCILPPSQREVKTYKIGLLPIKSP